MSRPTTESPTFSPALAVQRYALRADTHADFHSNEKKTKLVRHTPKAYRRLLTKFVKKAGSDYAEAQEGANLLGADLQAVRRGRDQFDESPAGSPRQRELTAWLRRPQDTDFQTAENFATKRVAVADAHMSEITIERAIVEHLYDRVVDEQSHGGQASPTLCKSYALDARDSLNRLTARRDRIETQVDSLVTWGRLPGGIRKLGGKVVGGALSFAVSGLTGGILGADVRKDERGFVKGNVLGRIRRATPGITAKGQFDTALPSKGFPVKITLLNDIRSRIVAFKQEWNMREGTFIIDKLSAGLGLFNEAVVQNVINIGGWIGTYLAVIGGILALAGAAAYGVGAIVGGVINYIGLALAGLGIAAALVKSAINGFRATVAFTVALRNQNAKHQNELNARAKRTAIETGASAAQVLGKAVSAGGGVMGTGGVMGGGVWSQADVYSSMPAAAEYATRTGVYGAEIGFGLTAALADPVEKEKPAGKMGTWRQAPKQNLGSKTKDLFNPETRGRFSPSKVKEDDVKAELTSEALRSRVEQAEREQVTVSRKAKGMLEWIQKAWSPIGGVFALFKRSEEAKAKSAGRKAQKLIEKGRKKEAKADEKMRKSAAKAAKKAAKAEEVGWAKKLLDSLGGVLGGAQEATETVVDDKELTTTRSK